MPARWTKEVVNNFKTGQYGKAAKIIRGLKKSVERGGEGSYLSVTGVLHARLNPTKEYRAKNLSEQMAFGNERSLIAKKKKTLFIKDKLRRA